jgi:hypothetical protein
LIFVGKQDYFLAAVGHFFKNLQLGLFVTKPSFKSRKFKKRMTDDSERFSRLFLPLHRQRQQFRRPSKFRSLNIFSRVFVLKP